LPVAVVQADIDALSQEKILEQILLRKQNYQLQLVLIQSLLVLVAHNSQAVAHNQMVVVAAILLLIL